MRQTGTIALKIRGEVVEMKLSIPAGEAEPVEMLDAARTMTDAIVGAMARKAERETGPISCRAGCGACCKQLVPLSRVEARLLAELVDRLPPERGAAVRERFARAVERLDAAGLAAPLRDAAARGGRPLREIGLEYFAQNVECPFLEAGSCSIHPDRPLACREYLVTSPAEHCANPAPETVRTVPMPARVSNGFIQISAPGETVASGFVALPLALEWAAAHPEPPARRPGPAMLKEIVESLTKS